MDGSSTLRSFVIWGFLKLPFTSSSCEKLTVPNTYLREANIRDVFERLSSQMILDDTRRNSKAAKATEMVKHALESLPMYCVENTNDKQGVCCSGFLMSQICL